MRIDRIDTDTFSGMRDEWNRLLGESGSNSIFLTWEWIHTWWSVFGDEQKYLYVLAVYDESGQLMGIAPCYINTKKSLGLVPIREVRFLGYGESVGPDYLDFITRPHRRAEIAAAFLDYIWKGSSGWDVLNLTDLSENSPVTERLREMQEADGFRLVEARSACCPYASLPQTWEEYVGSLSSNMRYNIRRKVRKLERDFNVRFYAWSDTDTLSSAMEKLGQLHRKRWKEQDISHSFADDRYNNFHEKVAAEFLNKGNLRLYVLEMDDSICAMLYCFKHCDKVFYYQSGHDPEYANYSIGTVMFAYAIREAIAENTTEFDFLRGSHEYKYNWSNADRNTVTLTAGNGNLAGKIHFTGALGKSRIRDYLKRNLPPAIYDSLKNIRSNRRPGDVKADRQ